MKNLIFRFNKIAFGSTLILLAMGFGDQYSMAILLSLAAIPIIFLGMFDWHPTEYVLDKIVAKIEKTSTKTRALKTRLAA